MRLKIVNKTGNPADSEIVNADSGEALEGVLSVSIEVSRYAVKATLVIMQPEYDVLIEKADIRKES